MLLFCCLLLCAYLLVRGGFPKRLIDMVSRTRRTVLRISPSPRDPSPGAAHSGSGSSRPPSQANREEDVHVKGPRT